MKLKKESNGISKIDKLRLQDKVRALLLPPEPKEIKTMSDMCDAFKHNGYAKAMEDILFIILTD